MLVCGEERVVNVCLCVVCGEERVVNVCLCVERREWLMCACVWRGECG